MKILVVCTSYGYGNLKCRHLELHRRTVEYMTPDYSSIDRILFLLRKPRECTRDIRVPRLHVRFRIIFPRCMPLREIHS